LTTYLTSPSGDATTDLVYVEDHKGLSVADMLGQFHDSPRLMALIKAMSQSIQIAEDEQFNMLLSQVLELASAGTLDQYGAIVGEGRDGLLDHEYRQIIKGKASVLVSHGTVDELIDIYAQLTYPSRVRYVPLHQTTGLTSDGCGGFVLYARRDEPMSDQLLRKVGLLMAMAKPATFEMECTVAPAGYFGFDLDPEAEPWDVGVWVQQAYPLE